MENDKPRPPVYSDDRLNVYVGDSWEELQQQTRAQWVRELAEGTVSQEDLTYRLRQLATSAGKWELIPCDKRDCGVPGATPLYVFGSPTGVADYIEKEMGAAIPGGRDRLLSVHDEADTRYPSLDGNRRFSLRVLVLCPEHAPSTNLAGDVRVEPGCEQAFKDLFERMFGQRFPEE